MATNDDKPVVTSRMIRARPLTMIAGEIAAHLARFAADPSINVPETVTAHDGPLPRLYDGASAGVLGGGIDIRYRRHSTGDNLVRSEAEAYLTWLNAGNVGKYGDMPEVKARATMLEAAKIARANAARVQLQGVDWSAVSDTAVLRMVELLSLR